MDIYEKLAVWSQIFGSVAFMAVLVYLFERYLKPAVIAAQNQKNAELAEAERRRDAAKEEVQRAKREFETTDEEVKAIRERAVIDAHRDRMRILGDAKTEGERLLRVADGELDRSRAAARDAFRGELLDRAMNIARRSAAARIDVVTDRELVSGVLRAVGGTTENGRENGAEVVHA